MDYCNYHPLSPATFACEFCHTHHCDTCVDEGERGIDPVCFTCGRPVDHLGSANQATPFWRRLEESFRYPLKGGALFLIVSVSLLGSILAYVPLGFIWYLAVTGAFLKYCFSCLENTARGLLVPPDITEAYGGGVALLGNLLVMLLAAGGAVFAAYYFLGPQIAGLLAFLIVIALPAVIIIYGMTESLAEALSPANLLQLITAIGLPYGLLLAFIMIMSASVGVISELIGYEYSLLSNSLRSLVSNYYTVVVFHIMGYMIFQYQGKLGFSAREDFGEEKPPRSAQERLAAKIDVRLKEGDYNQVVELLEKARTQFPSDREFNRQYFEFFHATGRNVEKAASRYLDYLVRSDQEHQLVIVYKRTLQVNPNYRPDTAATRHRLAMACKESGDPRSCAGLINGMHKDFPDYSLVVEAYQLMAEALDDIPHQSEQAKKCRLFTKKLAAAQARKSQAPEPEPGRTQGSPLREKAGTVT